MNTEQGTAQTSSHGHVSQQPGKPRSEQRGRMARKQAQSCGRQAGVPVMGSGPPPASTKRPLALSQETFRLLCVLIPASSTFVASEVKSSVWLLPNQRLCPVFCR